jgi:hypothetical protein
LVATITGGLFSSGQSIVRMVSDDARTKGRIIETSKPMTRPQALEKAQRVWGIRGAVYCFHETFFEVSVHTRFHYIVSFGMGIRGMRRLLTPRGEAHNDTEGPLLPSLPA